MAIVKTKPTSAGRRFVVKVVDSELHKGAPYAPLVEKKSKSGGRNNKGRITTRHRGGGHKQRYRVIDFKRDKDGIPGTVERIEYDPNRTANIALIKYADGERRYIIAPKGVEVGQSVVSGEEAERIGLVSMCVEDDELQQIALDTAVELANGSQSAIRWTKYSLNNWLRQAGPIFDASTALEMLGFMSEDVKEGVLSHREKRAPNFRKDCPL